MKKNSSAVLVVAIMLLLILTFSQDLAPASIPVQHTADIGAPLLPSASHATTIHFIHVGQGDAILICSGSSTVLIDGGSPDYGNFVVEYLTRQGIARLDAVIATHPHKDHIGGLIAVLEAFDVDAFYTSDETDSSELYQQLLRTAAAQGLQPQFPNIGDRITFQNSSATLTTLAPGENSAEIFDSRNSDAWSLVFRLDAEDCSALFTGDATFGVEQSMLQQNEAALNCDILKVAGHGTDRSSCEDFIHAVSPAYAVISYGEDTTFPADQVYDRLQRLHTVVLETPKDGTVVLQLQNGEVSIQP